MRAVLQRVLRASVTMKETGERREIEQGLLIFLAVAPGDTEAQAQWLAEKIIHLRIFEDAAGKMNLSCLEIPESQALIVSQFTLYGDCRKGRRPSFTDAAPPAIAVPLYERFAAFIRNSGMALQTGEFGADMLVEIANDGPVTLIIDSPSPA